jgi:dimethylamine/trimethylamine dehydrogenase
VTADGDIGGVMRWIPRLPGLGDWGRVVDWRRAQLASLRRQVEVHTRSELTGDDVLAYGAAIVVVATGARWAADGLNPFSAGPLPGIEHVRALTPEQVMVEGAPLEEGTPVTVLDCEGYFVGAGLAERTALAGHPTTLVTPFEPAAPWCDQTLEGPRLRARLAELGVVVRSSTMPSDARDLGSETVILATQRVSNDGLALALEHRRAEWATSGVELVVSTGDCVAPRLIADAIFDGHRVGREIDSGDPSRALPWLRERPLVAAPPSA